MVSHLYVMFNRKTNAPEKKKTRANFIACPLMSKDFVGSSSGESVCSLLDVKRPVVDRVDVGCSFVYYSTVR